MSLKQYIYALVDNILAQINADQRRKASYTTLYIQQLLIAHINAMAQIDIITSDPGVPELAWELLSEKLKLAGLTAVEYQLSTSNVGPGHIIDHTEFPWVLST